MRWKKWNLNNNIKVHIDQKGADAVNDYNCALFGVTIDQLKAMGQHYYMIPGIHVMQMHSFIKLPLGPLCCGAYAPFDCQVEIEVSE